MTDDDFSLIRLIVVSMAILAFFGMLLGTGYHVAMEKQKTIQVIAESNCTRAEVTKIKDELEGGG